jgi:hypothetical protein
VSEVRSKSPRYGYARQIFWLPGSHIDLVPIAFLGMFRESVHIWSKIAVPRNSSLGPVTPLTGSFNVQPCPTA